MIVDLDPLPYRLAFGIIEFCINHDIDREKCMKILEASSAYPIPDIDWTLDIPEEYASWMILKLV